MDKLSRAMQLQSILLEDRRQRHRSYRALWSNLAEPRMDLDTSSGEPPRLNFSSRSDRW